MTEEEEFAARYKLEKAGADPQQAALVKRFGNKPPAGYRWKQDGSQEFIPGGPADQKAQLQAVGEGTVGSVVADLRDKFSKLDKGGGVTNTKKAGYENLAAGVASSEPGQFVGRMLGTENQSERNAILMTRPVLLQAIMKATGMSSKQMDSNAELKLYLSTATDPKLDLQANMDALDRIDKMFGGKKPGTPPAAPAATNGVKTPDGQTHYFPTPAAAAAFKKAAGL